MTELQRLARRLVCAERGDTPMSENDPWEAVAARPIHDFIDCGDDETTLVFRMGDVKAARAAEATQHQQEVATLRAERDHQYTQAVEATQRALLAEQALANVEAERDRLQRVNECVYEVCGCGNMADAHCMICCRPLTEHRLIPTRELEEIQRRFALYAEDLAERDRLKAALSQITALDFEKVNGRHSFYSGAAMFVKAWLLAYAALSGEGTAKP